MDSLFTNLDGTPVSFEKMEYAHLSQLVDYDEGYKIEFKSTFDTAVQKKLSKSICSFANCSGGWLFIGITNCTKSIVDIPKPNGEIELNIINSIKRFVDLEVLNLIKVRFLENPNNIGNGVIVIYIKEGLHPPYISNGAIYVRAGAQSDPVPAERVTVDYLYKKSDRTSILLLKGINEKEVLSTYNVKYIKEHLKIANKIDELQKDIYKILERNDIFFPSSSTDAERKSIITVNSAHNFAINMLNFNRGEEQNTYDFLKKEIALIKEFIQVYPIKCNQKNLFSFGDLKIYYNALTQTTTIDGTDSEKARYNDIIEARKKIEKLCAILPLYKVSQFVHRIDLVIANEGNYYDEDIVLSLQIPKDSFFNFAELTLHSMANEYNEILLNTTAKDTVPAADEYDNYSVYSVPTPPMQMDGLYGLVENKAEKRKQECENELVYSYSPFEIINYNEEYDIIKIRFNKLNPNQIKSLPAPLFFNCELSEIQYSIVSKYSIKKITQIIKKQ